MGLGQFRGPPWSTGFEAAPIDLYRHARQVLSQWIFGRGGWDEKETSRLSPSFFSDPFDLRDE
jgi:hypothetical protein